MIMEWFVPNPPPTMEWFGLLSGTIARMEGGGTTAVAAIIGPQGNQGTASIVIDPEVGNRLRTSGAGLFVPPIAVGELPDMNLIFENSLL